MVMVVGDAKASEGRQKNVGCPGFAFDQFKIPKMGDKKALGAG